LNEQDSQRDESSANIN